MDAEKQDVLLLARAYINGLKAFVHGLLRPTSHESTISRYHNRYHAHLLCVEIALDAWSVDAPRLPIKKLLRMLERTCKVDLSSILQYEGATECLYSHYRRHRISETQTTLFRILAPSRDMYFREDKVSNRHGLLSFAG
jgi:hypothetical protein